MYTDMDRIDQRKITRNLTILKKVMRRDIDGIAERLTEKGIFTKLTTNEIGNTELQMKCGVFINNLLRSGPRAYQCFLDVLEEYGYRKLMVSLEKSRTVCSGMGHGWNDEREKTFILPPPPQVSNTVKHKEKDELIETENQDTDSVQLERMATFVMDTVIDNSRNNGNAFDSAVISKRIAESDRESSDELINLFKTLRCTSVN